jgi:hypothetical protein
MKTSLMSVKQMKIPFALTTDFHTLDILSTSFTWNAKGGYFEESQI